MFSITGLVSGKVRRSTNETVEDTTQPEVTTTTQTSTTSTQPYDPYGTLDDLYRVPNDITWLPLGYDPNFDGTSTIPDTLSGSFLIKYTSQFPRKGLVQQPISSQKC